MIKENHLLRDDGMIFLNKERSILFPADTYGLLYKELTDNIGKERIKGFFMRFGAEAGKQDAKLVKKWYKHHPLETLIRKGPVYHQQKGHAIVNITKLEIQQSDNRPTIHLEGIWKNSFEAEAYLRQFGTYSKTPVCYTLSGYASGYLSEICNQTVIFREIQCVAKGDPYCSWTARTIGNNDEEMEEQLKLLDEQPIVKELEITYENLLEERNNLRSISELNNKLTELILKGTDIKSLIKKIHEIIQIPILIFDAEFSPLASQGIAPHKIVEIRETIQTTIYDRLKTKKIRKKTVPADAGMMVVHSIVLQEEVTGYCVMLLEREREEKMNFFRMVLEQISIACSLILLNEKTKIATEERIESRFIEKLVKGEYTEDELVMKGILFGIDTNQPYYIVSLDILNKNNNIKKDYVLLEEGIDKSFRYFKKTGRRILAGQNGNEMFLLIPVKELYGEPVLKFCKKYVAHLSKLNKSLTLVAGISRRGKRLTDAPDHYREAVSAMAAAGSDNPVVTFESLGLLGILIHSNNKDEIRKLAHAGLDPLMNEKGEKKIEMLRTLYIYLINGGNLEQTSSELKLSLSGLRYRIAKIEEKLNKNLKSPIIANQLLMSIQALIITGDLNFETRQFI